MPLLIQCPNCKRLLGPTAKVCLTKTGKGCGKSIPHDRKIYYAQWRDPYGRTRQKKIGPTKKAAENFLRKVETAIVEERYIDREERAPVLSIREFVKEHYRPWCMTNNKGYNNGKRAWLDRIVSMWGNLMLDELTYEHLAWFQRQMKSKKKLVTFNRVHATVSHMYTIAIKMQKASHNPLSGTSELKFKEQGKVRYLTLEETKALLGGCTAHLKPIVQTALHTGMRRGEILGLRLGKHVDLPDKMIHLKAKETKSGRDRHIPINEHLAEVFAELAEGKERGDYLFAKGNGDPYQEVKRSFKTAMDKAKIKGASFHTLRHTFASHLVMNGVDLYTVGDLLGHSDYKMTQKYAHLSQDHRAKAVAVLDKVLGADSISQSSVSGDAYPDVPANTGA